jgi:uncharacterized protein YdhG (YjbR/CyaY superfamily)
VAQQATIDDYLAALPEERRVGLEELRQTILSVMPDDVVEAISYGIPAFKHKGKAIVYCAAFKDHYSVYPATDAVIEGLGDEIRPHLAGKGTIRFAADAPLPTDLVRRIVEIRLAESAAGAGRSPGRLPSAE